MDEYTRPNWSKAALLTIDMQNDFVQPGAVAEIAGTYDRLSSMQIVLNAMRSAGRPIIHVIRLYEQDGSNADLCRKAAIEGGKSVVAPESEGARLVEAMLPDRDDAVPLQAERLLAGEFLPIGEREWAMYKPRWGAFYRTRLESFLRERDVDTIVVIGCNFPNCPRTTIYEASERDFRIGLVSDAVSGVYDKGLDEMRGIGVQVWTTSQFQQWAQEEGTIHPAG